MSAPPRTPIPRLVDLPLALATDRLQLRPYVDADVDAMWPHLSDPTLARLMSSVAHASKAQTLATVQAAHAAIRDNSGVTWAIVRDGAFAGAIGVNGIRWQAGPWRLDRGELGYWLARPHWGQGLMTEAVTRVLAFAFATLGLHKVTVGCLDDNAASRRIIEKVGFRFVARLEEEMWRDDAWCDYLRWELSAAQWAELAQGAAVPGPGSP